MLCYALTKYTNSASWPSATRLFRAHLSPANVGSGFSYLGLASRLGSIVGKIIFGAMLTAGVHWSHG